MSRAIFGGFLGGLGEAYHQANVLQTQQEMERRKSLAEAWHQRATDPAATPEAQDYAYQQQMGILGTPWNRSLKPEHTSLEHYLNVVPKVGQSLPYQAPQTLPAPGGPLPQAQPPVPAPTEPPALQLPGAAPAPMYQPLSGTPPALQPPSAPPELYQQPPGQGPSLALPPAQRLPPELGGSQAQTIAPPAWPEGVTIPGRRTPEQMQELEARGAGLKTGAEAAAKLPAELELADLRYRFQTDKMREDAKAKGIASYYDPITGRLQFDYENYDQLSPKMKSEVDRNISIAKKNAAQTELNTFSEALKQSQTALNNARLDPNSAVYMQARAQTQLARQRVAIAEANLGLRTKSYLADYFGVDEEGKALPGAITDPETGLPVGIKFQRFYGPTATTLTRMQAVDPMTIIGKRLQDFAMEPENADLFGKIGGKWTDFTAGNIGTNHPNAATLLTMIKSFAALNAASHQWRAYQATENLAKTLNKNDSPEAFAAAVQGYIDAGAALKQRPGAQPPPAPPKGPPGTPRAGVIIAPDGVEHHVTDVDAALKRYPGVREKK